MTDPKRALIAVLLDRSGSMEAIKSDTEGGFNAFIDGQRSATLDIRVTLGANMDAVAIGEKLGFSADRSMTYATDADGVESAWAATTSYVSRRMAAPAAMAVTGFSAEEREAARGRQ